MNRGCPDWPFYGQHGALTSTLSRVSTMYGLRLVVEVGEPAHDGPSVSVTRLDLERALSGS